MKEGVFYSLSMSAQTVYNDIDKTMLSRLSTLNATGIYGAAYRIVDVSCAPLKAMTSAAYPSFFREGQKGIAAAHALAKRILHKATFIALSASVGMWVSRSGCSPASSAPDSASLSARSAGLRCCLC